MASGTSPNITPPPRDAEGGRGPPDPAAFAELLDRYAPLATVDAVPELKVFRGRDLLQVWNAAERLAGTTIPAPFWAYPWPAGIALARVLLDHPEWVTGRRVLDLGTGGGIVALAAARAGAREVVANDVDAWALATARLAARRQELELTPLAGDLTYHHPEQARDFGLITCGDLAYERRSAPRQRAFLERGRTSGARVLVADAGRAYFDASGLTPLASYTLEVPADVEGVGRRTARVFAFP